MATNEEVRIIATPELLAEMEGRWSPMVQVWFERPKRPGDPWEMTIRTLAQAIEEWGNNVSAGLTKWAEEMERKRRADGS